VQQKLSALNDLGDEQAGSGLDVGGVGKASAHDRLHANVLREVRDEVQRRGVVSCKQGLNPAACASSRVNCSDSKEEVLKALTTRAPGSPA